MAVLGVAQGHVQPTSQGMVRWGGVKWRRRAICGVSLCAGALRRAWWGEQRERE